MKLPDYSLEVLQSVISLQHCVSKIAPESQRRRVTFCQVATGNGSEIQSKWCGLDVKCSDFTSTVMQVTLECSVY